MAKKKGNARGGKPQPSVGKKTDTAPKQAKKSAVASAPKKSKTPWIVAGLLVVGVVAGLIFASSGSKSAFGIPPEEAKYMGRLLPADYQEPSVTGAQTYTATIKMTNVTPVPNGTQITIPLDQVVSNKIVYFEYTKPGSSEPIPMVAYIKPSGKLFVGVSACPPCKGKGQRIEPDLTLTCETCGTKRTLENGVGVSGTCKLYPLDEVPAQVTGNSIAVDRGTLDSWTPQPLDRPTS